MSNNDKADAYRQIANKISEALSIASQIGDFSTDHTLRHLFHTLIDKEKTLRNTNQ